MPYWPYSLATNDGLDGPTLIVEVLGAPPLARFGSYSAQLPPRILHSVQPVPREAACSACTPDLADGQGFSAALRCAKPSPKEGQIIYHQLATRFGRNNHQISGREPLDNEALYRHVPSIFAREAHDSRSDRYVYVPQAIAQCGRRPAYPKWNERSDRLWLEFVYMKRYYAPTAAVKHLEKQQVAKGYFMLKLIAVALISVSTVTGVSAVAQTPAAAPAPAHYTTDKTDVGTLLDDPASKAILVKYLPDLVTSDQIDMARSMTLRALQPFAADKVTDEKLAAIDADLVKLPVKK